MGRLVALEKHHEGNYMCMKGINKTFFRKER
jgi:hypothetical protein